MTLFPFFASSFVWNFALGMTYMLIPLYAYSLGLSGVAIGTLVSAPVIVQVSLNLLGGAYTDRIGGKRMAVGSCVATALAGLVFMWASSFAGLLMAQLVLVGGRAMFWPATWSLGSQLPGDTARLMSRLNAVTSVGQIAGTAGAGALIAAAGFKAGFAVYVGANVVALVLLMRFRSPPRKGGPAQPILATYAALARKPAILYAIACAYASAMPFSLSNSFYPILMLDHGFDSDASGALVALRGLGAAVAGVVAGRFVRRTSFARTPALGAISIGACVALVAAFAHPLWVMVFMLGVGLGGGVMTLYFQLLVTESSRPEQRGSAMAFGGLGWSLSHITTPFIMGALKDHIGIVATFYAAGAWTMLFGLALGLAHRRVFATKAT